MHERTKTRKRQQPRIEHGSNTERKDRAIFGSDFVLSSFRVSLRFSSVLIRVSSVASLGLVTETVARWLVDMALLVTRKTA
jgi:hypothetical protein